MSGASAVTFDGLVRAASVERQRRHGDALAAADLDALLLGGPEAAERRLNGVEVARDVREHIFANRAGDLRLQLGALGFADEDHGCPGDNGACAVFHGTEHSTGGDLRGCARRDSK